MPNRYRGQTRKHASKVLGLTKKSGVAECFGNMFGTVRIGKIADRSYRHLLSMIVVIYLTDRLFLIYGWQPNLQCLMRFGIDFMNTYKLRVDIRQRKQHPIAAGIAFC